MRKRNLDLEGGGMQTSTPPSPAATTASPRPLPHSPTRRAIVGRSSPPPLAATPVRSSQPLVASLQRATSSISSFLDTVMGSDPNHHNDDENDATSKSIIYLTLMFLVLASMSGFTTYLNSNLRAQLDQTVSTQRFLQQHSEEKHEKELQGLRDLNARLDHWLESTEIRLGQVTTDYELKRDEVTQLQAKCKSYAEGAIRKSKCKGDKRKGRESKCNDISKEEEIHQLKMLVGEIRLDRDEADEELSSMTTQIIALRKARASLTERVEELVGVIVSTRKELEDKKHETSELSLWKDVDLGLDSLNPPNAKQSESEEVRGDDDSLPQEAQDIKDDAGEIIKDDAGKEISKLKMLVEEIQQDRDDADDELSSMKEQLFAVRNDRASLAKRAEVLVEVIVATRKELEDKKDETPQLPLWTDVSLRLDTFHTPTLESKSKTKKSFHAIPVKAFDDDDVASAEKEENDTDDKGGALTKQSPKKLESGEVRDEDNTVSQKANDIQDEASKEISKLKMLVKEIQQDRDDADNELSFVTTQLFSARRARASLQKQVDELVEVIVSTRKELEGGKDETPGLSLWKDVDLELDPPSPEDPATESETKKSFHAIPARAFDDDDILSADKEEDNMMDKGGALTEKETREEKQEDEKQIESGKVRDDDDTGSQKAQNIQDEGGLFASKDDLVESPDKEKDSWIVPPDAAAVIADLDGGGLLHDINDAAVVESLKDTNEQGNESLDAPFKDNTDKEEKESYAVESGDRVENKVPLSPQEDAEIEE